MRKGTLGLGALALLSLTTSTASAQYYAPDPPPSAVPWYELLELDAFVDAYASLNYAFPKPGTGNNLFRLYDVTNGFAISWVGLEASYAPDPVGATVSLRFGPSADRFSDSCLHENVAAVPCDTGAGLAPISQGFVSWKPGGAEGALQFDFGKFESSYGIEPVLTQHAFNYTRGLIANLAVPFFFTGLRATYEPLSELRFMALAVNGQNASLDNNIGKTFGLLATYQPTPSFWVRLGWLAGPEQDDFADVACPAGESYSPTAEGCTPDRTDPPAQSYGVGRGGANSFDAWRHHGDLVLAYRPSEHFRMALSGVIGLEGVREGLASDDIDDQTWWGVAVHAQQSLSEVWRVGARAEYYADPDGRTTGVDGARLGSGTITVDALLGGAVALRLDNRVDLMLDASGTTDVFPSGVTNPTSHRDANDYQLTSTLGVIAYTD